MGEVALSSSVNFVPIAGEQVLPLAKGSLLLVSKVPSGAAVPNGAASDGPSSTGSCKGAGGLSCAELERLPGEGNLVTAGVSCGPALRFSC